MRALKLLLVVALAMLLAACGADDTTPEPTPDPQALLAEGITQLQDATSFKYEVDVSGYRVNVPISGLDLPEGTGVSFKYASGTFQVPDRLSARVQFRLGVLSTTAELVALGSTQYFRGELITGNRWLQGEFLPGFRAVVPGRAARRRPAYAFHDPRSVFGRAQRPGRPERLPGARAR
ncbi:MAG: hypothetical protein M5U29_12170 [Anaerolineae bacterium]|nr:hypothetical protein [Anaerolineae bacterium]